MVSVVLLYFAGLHKPEGAHCVIQLSLLGTGLIYFVATVMRSRKSEEMIQNITSTVLVEKQKSGAAL